MSGASSWQDVSLDSPARAESTLSGLTPATTYRIQFRFTNDWGTSDWGYVEAATTSATSSGSGSGIVTLVTKKKTTKTSSNVTLVSNLDVTSPSQPVKVNLNDFAEYIGAGKQMDVRVGDVLYFTVGSEQHSITVQEIGSDYVVLVLASIPQTVRLQLGSFGQYDVTKDGQPDIQINLNKLTSGTASLTFKSISQKVSEPITTNETAVGRATNSLFWVLLVGGSIFLLIIVVLGKYFSDNKKL